MPYILISTYPAQSHSVVIQLKVFLKGKHMNAKEIVQNYKGIVEPRKIASLIVKAKKLGLPEHMIEDVVQDFVLKIIEFKYDSQKSNGASEITALLAIFENKIIDIVRRLEFEKDFIEKKSHSVVFECNQIQPLQMRMDIQTALKVLTPVERRTCMQLANGLTIKEIAKLQKWRFTKARKIVSEIRNKLTKMNLNKYIDEKC